MAKISRERFKTYKNVFDEFTLRNLFKLSSEGFFEDLTNPLLLGKEANVFIATKDDNTRVIVKIYRLENCNFNKMYEYIRQDPRYLNMSTKRREVIFSWTKREFRNLMMARELIRVPTPYKAYYNIVVMEYVGDEDGASPMLKDATLKSPGAFFDEVIAMVDKLYCNGLVHGDLSHFNILVHLDRPVFIDFSQATVTTAAQAPQLLYRDLVNLCNYFEQNYSIIHNPKDLANSILNKVRKDIYKIDPDKFKEYD